MSLRRCSHTEQVDQARCETILAGLFLQEGYEVRFVHDDSSRLQDVLICPTKSDPNFVAICSTMVEAKRIIERIKESGKARAFLNDAIAFGQRENAKGGAS